MNRHLSKLDIQFYTPDELKKDLVLFKPYTVGIQLDSKCSISNILYKEYEIKQNPYHIYANINSLDKSRLPLISYIIENIIERIQLGQSTATIKNEIKGLEFFANWLTNNSKYFPSTIHAARDLLHEFSFSLKLDVKSALRSPRTANYFLSFVAQALTIIFKDKNRLITSGLVPIKVSRHMHVKTKKSEITDIIYSFKFYYFLFKQISDFILNNKPYPLNIELPKGKYKILPSKNWIISEKDLLNTILDSKKIEEHNLSFHSHERKQLALVALRAYFMQFLSITGMNDSTASTLEYNEKFKEKKKTYLFRNVKNRARKKIVEFRINKEFSQEFITFIKLREYLLNGHEFKYLFFYHYEENASLSFAQKRGNFNYVIHEQMTKNIDENLPRITSKQIRVNKNSYILKRYGEVVASNIIQNKPQTNLAHYSENTETEMLEEFTTYFNALNKSVIFSKNKGIDIPVGQCSKYNTPISQIQNQKYKSDCNSFEGCLFCEKYGIHADEIDIRKLFSLEYIINETKYISLNIEQFNRVNKPILNRIDSIFKQLITYVPSLKPTIENIKNDVYNLENLSPYFQEKLKYLLKQGILK